MQIIANSCKIVQTIVNFARSLGKKGLPGKSEIASVGEFLCKLLVLLSIIMMVMMVLKVTSMITLMTRVEKMKDVIKYHLGKTKVGPKSKGARQKAHLENEDDDNDGAPHYAKEIIPNHDDNDDGVNEE